MSNKEIQSKKEKLVAEYNDKKNTTCGRINEIQNEYNELLVRETINDYLYYGYGLKTFVENDYDYAKNITIERLEQLFAEQRDYLGDIE